MVSVKQTSLTSVFFKNERNIMKDRKCTYCKEPIPAGKRMDSKFCGNSCKAKHWEEKLKNNPKKIIEQKPATKEGLDGLRGIVGHLPVKTDVSDVNQTSLTSTAALVETEAYKNAFEEKQKVQQYVGRTLGILNNCNQQIERIQNYVPYEKPKPSVFKTKRAYSLDMELAENFQRNDFTDFFQQPQSSEEENKWQDELNKLKETKSELQQYLQKGQQALKQSEEKLKSIHRYERVQVNKNAIPILNIVEALKNKKIQMEQDEMKKNEEVNHTAVEINRQRPVTNGISIMSSKELREMDYKCLNFTGQWKEFLGQPAIVFHLAVHGKPGEGKSTFCIQFANYLAENFGNVVYISGEEGFSKTLRDKVVNNNITSPHLFFSNSNSYEKIKDEIENKFHFIFMDSLDTLKIDAGRLRELKELYPDSAFITISQSTKDGKMRGSQEIIHDADITLKVENGTAITTKNRFKERGMEFEVFAKKKNENGKIKELRNII
ncbi:MAG: hypothetical protein ACK40M_10440 [Flavobacteriales bacterium]